MSDPSDGPSPISTLSLAALAELIQTLESTGLAEMLEQARMVARALELMIIDHLVGAHHG
jgi:hypothetical protein